MASNEQLRFAQRFPFSSTAKKIVKDSGISLDEVPEEVLNRAAVMVSIAFSEREYALNLGNSSELLEHEVLAFPIAKIFVSLMKDKYLYKSFALMMARSTFLYLEKAPGKKQLSLDLAEEFSLEFEVVEQNGFFVSVPLRQYLGIMFNDKALKLVNQAVEQGRVFLNINLFCRFLSELVFLRVFQGLPVATESVPVSLKDFAKQLSPQLKKSRLVEFNFKVEGKLNANAFPPCVASLYQKLLEGARLPHMARFFLATFLAGIGMPQQQILEAFKKSPDFDERVAGYQIKRIVEQKYAPASCEKIKSYGICPDQTCRVKHPLSYYRRQLRLSAKQKK